MGFAHQLVEDAERNGFEPCSLVDMDEYEDAVRELPSATQKPLMVFVTACYGTGEPTDNAKKMFNWVMSDASRPAMQNTPFTVFGLGKSRTYCDRYQAVGRAIDRRLEELGARRVFRRGEGDDDANIEDDFNAWRDDFWKQLTDLYPADAAAPVAAADAPFVAATCPATAARSPSEVKKIMSWLPGSAEAIGVPTWLPGSADASAKSPVTVPLAGPAVELHTPKSVRSAKHIELDLTGTNISYQTGDHVGVWPCNDPELVEAVAARLGVAQDAAFAMTNPPTFPTLPTFPTPCTVEIALSKYCDLTATVRRGMLELLAQHAADPTERQRLEEVCANTDDGKAEFAKYITQPHRTLLEVLNEFPSVQVPFDALLSLMLRTPLQHRYYSISSSSLVNPLRLSITADVVRYTTPTGRPGRGVCSNFMANARSTLPIFVRTSTFRLPKDPATPVICVAAGTGLAPIHGFIQERAYQRTHGMNAGRTVVFFGCFHHDTDFLYGDELTALHNSGAIELHTAFSHDQPDRIFVQHRMLERDADLWNLIHNQNAHVYVCGNAQTVGVGVFRALAEIAEEQGGMGTSEGEAYVRKLIEQGRYQDDVF